MRRAVAKRLFTAAPASGVRGVDCGTGDVTPCSPAISLIPTQVVHNPNTSQMSNWQVLWKAPSLRYVVLT